MFFGFDHPILKHGIGRTHWAIDRLTLDLDAFVPQIDLLADGLFDHIAANPHATVIDVTLADAQLLFIDRDNLVLSDRNVEVAGALVNGGTVGFAAGEDAAVLAP